MFRIASYNVENLFARPRALNGDTWSAGKPILDALQKVQDLFAKDPYSAADKKKMMDLLVQLDIYHKNSHGAVRRKSTQDPQWAWFRKNRGAFDTEPKDPTQSVQITATGRGDWIGWVELAKEQVKEAAVRMTARVIQDLEADVIAVIEADDRPALVRFNKELLNSQYSHIMLVDGNDERGIDVGIMTGENYPIESIRSHVNASDSKGIVFSRDCPQYEVRTPGGESVFVLVNHFKSQSNGGQEKRRRQAVKVREIAEGLVGAGRHVVVLGDLNEGPAADGALPENLQILFNDSSPVVDCYTLPGFDVGPRPGTFDSCGWRNRLDYILISRSLVPHFQGGTIFRRGLWGSRKTAPTAWQVYPELTRSADQASDHGAVVIDLNL